MHFLNQFGGVVREIGIIQKNNYIGWPPQQI